MAKKTLSPQKTDTDFSRSQHGYEWNAHFEPVSDTYSETISMGGIYWKAQRGGGHIKLPKRRAALADSNGAVGRLPPLASEFFSVVAFSRIKHALATNDDGADTSTSVPPPFKNVRIRHADGE